MRLKTLLMSTALIVCIGTLGGCKAGEDTGGEVIIEETGEQPTEKILTFFAPVDGKSSGAIAYRNLIEQYNNSHPDVHVVFEGIATADGFNEYLEERLDTGQGDDVFIVNEDSVKPLYLKGYFYDMSSLPAFETLNDTARSEALIGDIAYCMPVNMTAYALYVNLEVLEQYGLQPPENLETFLDCCRTIKAQGGTPLGLSRWHATVIPTLANGMYKVYNSEDSQDILNRLNTGEYKVGDYMLEGFLLFEQFIREGFYGEGLTGEAVDALRAGEQDLPGFAEGKTAFYFGPLEYMPWVEELNPQLDYQVQGVPVPGGTVTLPSVVSRLCVNPDSEYLEEALDFVSCLSEGICQGTMEEGHALLPVYKGMEFKLGNDRMRPAYETYMTGGQVPPENMQLYFTSWDTVRELCIEMFDGMTAQEAAAEYNRIQTEQIAGYKKQ